MLAACSVFIQNQGGRNAGTKTIRRNRRHVLNIFEEFGEGNSRKAYRMNIESFWKLHRILFKNDHVKKRKRGSTVNGPIHNSTRLSMALRWMAGGDKFDIASNHGVGIDQVLISV